MVGLSLRRYRENLSTEVTAQEIQERIAVGIPEAEIRAVDLKGGDHFEVTVVSSSFEGRSMVEQHRMVYAALGDAMRADIHALMINTLTPARVRETAAAEDCGN